MAQTMPPAAPDPDATVLRQQHGADPDATVQRTRLDLDVTVLRTTEPLPALPLPRAAPLALASGFVLHEYRIESVLGQGGFGITYLATDVNLNARVAIKEYLPQDIAFRAGDRSVSPNASRHRDRYRQGLDSFLVEARTLASFRHPAIVRVARFFEAHRTAYMVLEYEQGAPFKSWWPAHSTIGEKGLVDLLLPLLDGLAVVHAAGYLHRDIKPDNIQVRQADGRLVLLDFGSAGQTVALADEHAVVVTPGYAPIEQYGVGEQGAWTDLYALAATLYWAVGGRKPPDAEHRRANPQAMRPAVELGAGRFGLPFLQAIDAALDPEAARRPQSVAEFRQALCAEHLESLNLQEALQRGDTDDAAAARRRRPWQRVLTALRDGVQPRHWPLALKMSLAMLVTALLPMVMAGAWNLRGSVDALAQAELQNVEQIAHGTAGRLGGFVAEARQMVRALASDSVFIEALARPDPAAVPALRDKLVRIVAADPDVQLIMLMAADGTALVSNDAQVMGRNFAFRQYFREAMAGRSFATGITVGAVAGASGMFCAEPVRGADGRVLGALVLRVLGSSVSRILEEVRHDSTLTPLLLDGDGVLIHHPRAELLYSSLLPLPAARLAEIRADQRFRRDQIASLGETELAAAVLGARQTGHVSYRSAISGEQEIAGFAPVPGHDWVVAVTEPRARFEAGLQGLYTTMLWSVLLVGLLFTGLALRFARSIVRPIRGLTDAALALKAGDYEAARVPVNSRDEVGQLGRTFNVMIDVLRQRDREKAAAGPPGPPGPPGAPGARKAGHE